VALQQDHEETIKHHEAYEITIGNPSGLYMEKLGVC
jgi:hypothetical protein